MGLVLPGGMWEVAHVSGTPTPNFTGKGLPLCRLLLMELWKVPALMETSVARSLFLRLTITS